MAFEAPVGADPDVSVRIAQYRPDGIPVQGCGHGRIMGQPLDPSAFFIVADDAGPVGAKPDAPRCDLENAADRAPKPHPRDLGQS